MNRTAGNRLSRLEVGAGLAIGALTGPFVALAATIWPDVRIATEREAFIRLWTSISDSQGCEFTAVLK